MVRLFTGVYDRALRGAGQPAPTRGPRSPRAPRAGPQQYVRVRGGCGLESLRGGLGRARILRATCGSRAEFHRLARKPARTWPALSRKYIQKFILFRTNSLVVHNLKTVILDIPMDILMNVHNIFSIFG